MTGRHWADGPMLGFDLETTGVDVETDRAVTAALVSVCPGRETVTHRWVIDPGVPVPLEAARIHGYPTERVRAEGVKPSRAFGEISVLMAVSWVPSTPLVTSNGAFDLSLLDRELGRHLGGELAVAGPMIDVLLVDKACDRFRPGSRKLGDMCAHWSIELPDAHDAAADAVAALRLAWKLGKCRRWPRGRYGPSAEERQARGVVASGDAAALHVAQVRWHEEGQRGLAEYWRSSKAVAKTWEKVRRGEMMDVEAKAWIADLPAAADRVAAQAVGCWPMIPRPLVATERV